VTQLRDVDSLMVAALRETVAALDPPDSDKALVRLAEVTAAAIDSMPSGQLGMMLGQTAPILLKALQELEARSQKRKAMARPGKANWLQEQRAAHAQATTKRRQAG